MIESVFRRPHVRERLRTGPIASVIPDYLIHLRERGYRRSTIHRYVQAAEHFGRWLGRVHRATADIDAAVADVFVTQHLARCRCPMPHSRTVHVNRAALRQLLTALGIDGRRHASDGARSSDAVIAEFEHYLRDICGATPATRRYYLREARALLAMRFGDGAVTLTAVALSDVCWFVSNRAKDLTPTSANVVATAVRSFVRFLQLRGLASHDWSAAIPRAADWRLSRVPRVLTDEEVEAFLAAFDRRAARGRRDYAMAVCLLDLGLPADEVAHLTLDDLDWRARTVALAAGKSRRASRLPLPGRVARALADYLRHGRPPTTARAVFVHHRPPRGFPIGASAVRAAVRLAYARARLDRRLTGTHVLRHTAATRFLRAGISMKEIADLLRHRCLDTSALYAKVDVSSLATVALPWPGRR